MRVPRFTTAAVALLAGACSHAAPEQVKAEVHYSDYPRESSVSLPSAEPKCDSKKFLSYYYAGPGKKTPEAMVDFMAPEFDVSFRSRDRREVEVNASDLDTGDLVRIYTVSKDGDLWYPDGYATCAKN